MSVNSRKFDVTSYKYVSLHVAVFSCQKCWFGMAKEDYLVRKYQQIRRCFK